MSVTEAARDHLPGRQTGHRSDAALGSAGGCGFLVGWPLEDFPQLAELVSAADPTDLDEPPQGSQPAPAPAREVFKAGRWDRSGGDGGGFAAGGVADLLPPGPVLAGLAGDLWEAGLDRLTDDELVGVMGAARRLEAWSAGMKLAAVGDLWRRRATEADTGDIGAAQYADDEIATALTLTRQAANQVLDLAIALRRLPLTAAALTGGDIDLPRARVIANELIGLTDEHAAAVEAAIIGAAPGQTTGELGRAARRAVLAADPAAARKRKERALREARVERWSEHAGTAALAGRDLPPLSVLEADQHLSALAQQLKDAGCEGTMDTLRAQVYLALLTGATASALLGGAVGSQSKSTGLDPDADSYLGADSNPGTGRASRAGDAPGSKDSGSEGSGNGGNRSGHRLLDGTNGSGNCPPADTPSPAARQPTAPDDRAPAAGPAKPEPSGNPGAPSAKGSVNLTMPLATWLGLGEAPGHVAGFGPLDATDSLALADVLATQPGTKWCLTLTGPDGHPIAHGCTRTAPPTSRHRAPPTTGGPPPTGPPPGAGGPSPANLPPGTWPRPGILPPATRPPPIGPAPGTGLPADRLRPASQPPTPPGTRRSVGAGSRRAARSRAGPGGTDSAWVVALIRLGGGGCDHATETPSYVPSPKLRHLVKVRQPSCSFPGCSRPGIRTDLDHTIPFHLGGRTCLCNLGPLCRHHHQLKQANGWTLEQLSPGVMTWTTPSGRRHTVQHHCAA